MGKEPKKLGANTIKIEKLKSWLLFLVRKFFIVDKRKLQGAQ